jgi:hypothetical protein
MTANPLALLNETTTLTEIEQMILAESAQDNTAFDFIPTKLVIVPGGMNAFKASSGEVLTDLPAIIAISQKARAYWPSAGTGAPPFCASLDGVHGSLNPIATDADFKAAMNARDPHPSIRLQDAARPLPDSYDCATCPLSQWGSAHQKGDGGKSQACKSLRRLVILPDGWTQPALLTLPPTSIKNFDAYASGLQQKRSAYWAVRTTISLEARKSGKGDPYSVAVFAPTGKLTPPELQALIDIRRQYAELVRGMDITPDEYDTAPPADPAETLPF